MITGWLSLSIPLWYAALVAMAAIYMTAKGVERVHIASVAFDRALARPKRTRVPACRREPRHRAAILAAPGEQEPYSVGAILARVEAELARRTAERNAPFVSTVIYPADDDDTVVLMTHNNFRMVRA